MNVLMNMEQVQLHGGTRSTTMVCGTVERVLLKQQEWLPPGTLIFEEKRREQSGTVANRNSDFKERIKRPVAGSCDLQQKAQSCGKLT